MRGRSGRSWDLALLAAAALSFGCGGEAESSVDTRGFDAVVAVVDRDDTIESLALYGLRIGGGAARLCGACNSQAVAPDGRHIVWRQYDAAGEPTESLMLYSVPEGPRSLETNYVPVWSPDGRSLAYQLDATTILVGDGGGRDPIAVPDLPWCGGGATFNWAPDGVRLALLCDGTVFVSDRFGSPPVALPTVGGSARWAPDGFHLSVGSLDALEIVGADGSGHRVLPGSDTYSGWSADSSLVAVGVGDEVHVVDVDGQTVLRAPGEYAGWSPAEVRLAYYQSPPEGSGDPALLHFWSPTSEISVPVDEALGGVVTLEWSPDGSKVTYGGFAEGSPGILLDAVDGTELARFDDSTPRWSPSGSLLLLSIYEEGSIRPAVVLKDATGNDVARIAEQTRGAAWLAGGQQVGVIDEREVSLVRVADLHETSYMELEANLTVGFLRRNGADPR